MKAYAVFLKERVKDEAQLDIYQSKVPASREGHALKPLARYGQFEMLEGDPFEGAVILEFPSVQEARAWYDSPRYQEAMQHRLAGADYRVFIIEGVE